MNSLKITFGILFLFINLSAQEIKLNNAKISTTTLLSNGNYVVTDPFYDEGALTDIGIVQLYNGTTNALKSTLKGASANDQIGNGGVVPLTNGNFVVTSKLWKDAGNSVKNAFTWADGIIGINGTINSSNSFIGPTFYQQGLPGEYVGSTLVRALTNGNYLIQISGDIQDGGFGSVSFGLGNIGLTGFLSPTNSLMDEYGSAVGNLTPIQVGGGGIIELPNSNYLVLSPGWGGDDSFNPGVGAVTWGSGTIGVSGGISSENSIIGSKIFDNMGNLVGRSGVSTTVIVNASTYEVKIESNYSGGNVITKVICDSETGGVGEAPFLEIIPNGLNPVSGNIDVIVKLTNSFLQGGAIFPSVARNFEIIPLNNSAQSSAKLLFYLTQKDFDVFNNNCIECQIGPNLPTNPNDGLGISNLIIHKFSENSILPIILNPIDSDINWNIVKNIWEVSVDINGFSRFLISTFYPLPLNLISFSANQINKNTKLNWQTAKEVNTKSFDIERSEEGTKFIKIGTIASKNNSETNKYSFLDSQFDNQNSNAIYYRLKMIDLDGKFTYSKIVAVSLKNDKNITINPNPTSGKAILNLDSKIELINTMATITNASGLIVKQFKINKLAEEIDLGLLPKAVYLVKFVDGEVLKLVKD